MGKKAKKLELVEIEGLYYVACLGLVQGQPVLAVDAETAIRRSVLSAEPRAVILEELSRTIVGSEISIDLRLLGVGFSSKVTAHAIPVSALDAT